MPEVICSNSSCNKTISFDNEWDLPSECPYCFENLEREIVGLTLIYQMNQQRIEVPASRKTILGRRGLGAEVLSKIVFNGEQVVSRNHCSIEFRDNKFYLQDEGSLNGTYYGRERIDCKNAPQVIENGGLVFLGEEPFIGLVRYKAIQGLCAQNQNLIEQPPNPTRRLRCKLGCGYETEDPRATDCPICDTANCLVNAVG